MSSPRTFTIVEQAVTPKARDRNCEDGLVITDHFAAVIDGATTPHAVGTDGRTSGAIAKDALIKTIVALPAEATLGDFLHAAAQTIAEHATAAGLAPDLPTAVAVVYSAHHRQVWSVGDARWAVDGVTPDAARREVDQLAATARAIILRAALLRGATIDELRSNDIGRTGTNALRAAKVTFRNNPDAGALGFAALTGTPVPLGLTDTVNVPEGAAVVMTTDGYLSAAPTLADAETELAAALADDPLCIGPALATKCPAGPGMSFDDRTYLRLHT